MSNAARKQRRTAAKKARRARRKTPSRGKGGRFVKGHHRHKAQPAPVILVAPKKKRKSSKKKGKKMASKKKKGGSRKTAARGHRRGRGARRGRSKGGRKGFMPGKDDIHLFMGAAAYGWAESSARKDKDFILNKLPKPIDQLGFTGNTALLLWGAGVLTRNKWIQLAARSIAAVGIYQLATRGKLYDKGDAQFSLSGYEDDDDVVAQLQSAQLGALSPDAGLDGGAF